MIDHLEFLIKQPRLLKVLFKPFISNHWNSSRRVSMLLDHIKTSRSTFGRLAVPNGKVISIVEFRLRNIEYRLTLDHARWLALEGPLIFSLWEGIDRLFHISFCLSSRARPLTAYVGGIQGRRENGVMERYRAFTRAAYGMRPRDFLVEIFKHLCLELGVEEIRCVEEAAGFVANSDSNRDDLKLDYAEIWRERGGIYCDDGFFRLAPGIRKRDLESMSAKKRLIYRQRYKFLEDVAKGISPFLERLPAKPPQNSLAAGAAINTRKSRSRQPPQSRLPLGQSPVLSTSAVASKPPSRSYM